MTEDKIKVMICGYAAVTWEQDLIERKKLLLYLSPGDSPFSSYCTPVVVLSPKELEEIESAAFERGKSGS